MSIGYWGCMPHCYETIHPGPETLWLGQGENRQIVRSWCDQREPLKLVSTYCCGTQGRWLEKDCVWIRGPWMQLQGPMCGNAQSCRYLLQIGQIKVFHHTWLKVRLPPYLPWTRMILKRLPLLHHLASMSTRRYPLAWPKHQPIFRTWWIKCLMGFISHLPT